MAEMVCPHCGHDEYNEVTLKIDKDGYECASKYCGESFEEPIEDYEFNEAAKEAKLEAEADERRNHGNN